MQRGEAATMKGICIAAALTVLLNGTCFLILTRALKY
jgi:hypothetical protein